MNIHRIMALVVLSLLLLTSFTAEAAEYGATYGVPGISGLNPGQITTISVTVTNTGTLTWTPSGANPFRLSYHWYSGQSVVVFDGLRTYLPQPIAPGGKVTLSAGLQAPSNPGTYTLKWDMFREGVTWFSQQGVPTANQTVAVALQAVGEPPPLPPVVALLPPPVDPSGWRQDRGDASRTGWHLWMAPEPKGVVAWRLQVGTMINSSPVVATPDGTIYVVTEDKNGQLNAINPDGTWKWNIRLGNATVRGSPAIRSDGSLVVVGAEQVPVLKDGKFDRWASKGRVHLVHPSGWLLRVSQDFDIDNNSYPSSPLLNHRDDSAYILYNYGDDYLVKFDRNFASTVQKAINYDVTGVVRPGCPTIIIPSFLCGYWTPSSYPPPTSPAIDIGSSRMVVTGFDKTAVWDLFGGQIWQKDIPGGHTVAAYGGRLYIGTRSKRVESWDLNGNKLWEGQLGGLPVAPPALGQLSSSPYPRLVYVPASDGYLYFFNRAAACSSPVPDSPCVWRRKVGTKFAGAPAVLSIGGGSEIVVVASDANVLKAFRQDGTPLWSVPLDSPAVGSPAIVNGRIYVATQTSVFAIK